MKTRAGIVLLLLLAAFTVNAATTPEEYFERALRKADELKLETSALVELENKGELDQAKAGKAEVLQSGLLALHEDLEKASEGGHTLAIYWLANLDAKFSMAQPERTTYCESLHRAVDQGLLAAGVAYYHQCDRPYMRFDFQSPVHLKTMADLKQLLLNTDSHTDAYPLLALRSSCFQDVRAEIKEEKTLANMQARTATMLLTYDQYRAEAYYILASADMNDQSEPDHRNLTYLNQALALGCKDEMGLRDFYEKSFGAQASNPKQ